MRIMIPLAGILALAAAASAQQDPSPPKPDATARLESLREEIDAFTVAWRKDVAAKSGKASIAIPMRPDLAPFVAKFQAAAADYAGTDAAIPFLEWLVTNSGKDAAQAALATVTEHHAASPAVAQLVTGLEYLPRLVGDDAAKRFVDAVREKNADPDVRGWLALDEFGGTIDSAATDSAEYAAARKELLARAAVATDQRLRQEIQGKIDLREKLGVGAIAPDIEGVDLDGVAFKLSDYKGKVVFLDFWGDW